MSLHGSALCEPQLTLCAYSQYLSTFSAYPKLIPAPAQC
jgi:hypothetical protein